MLNARTRLSRLSALVAVGFAFATIAVAAPAGAQSASPLDGTPVSPGLGPTYGEEWCAPVGSENVPQSAPLALIPYGAIGCTLDRFESDPAAAQSLLASWGGNVKLPIFVEANIHGGEREGTDAMMQVVRDLVTLPYGTNGLVVELLDQAILIVIPVATPDGRVAGRRQNANLFDLNRDLLVQSQPEIRANTAYQLEWLAPVGLFLHGYYNPTLVDGLTKPHNPGLEYDKFLYWNQRRLDANQSAIEAIGREIQRPVNQWDERGISGTKNGNPAVAEGWDDWGPFYSQTYGAFFGVDGSTAEMCNNTACGGRLGSKREQYIVFYSSADFWLKNRNTILRD